MAKVELPPEFARSVGPEMKMDVHWVDVKLKNGERVYNVVVRGGRFFTGLASHPSGEGELPFVTEDVARVRRHKPAWWPFW